MNTKKSAILIGAICLVALLFPIMLGAQITFEKWYGGNAWDEGRCIQQTEDGGYIVVGYTYSFGPGENAVWLVKTDSLGDTLWTRTYGGGIEDYGWAVQQTTDSGYIVTGYTESFGPGSKAIWLIKTDAIGDTLWTRTYGGSSVDYGYSVLQTDDGYIIAGHTRSFGAGSDDVYLVKTDSIGDTLWTRTYGGGSMDLAYSVLQTEDSGYILVGDTYSYGAGGVDFYLVKTDSLGDTLWTRTFGGSDSDNGRSVGITQDGGYIMVGDTRSFGAGGRDVWLIKTDSQGDTIWTRLFGGSSSDYGYSVQQTTDGGYIVVGYTNSFGAGSNDVWIIKTDPQGDTMWTRTYGGTSSDKAYFVEQTEDGGYIVTGFTRSFGAGSNDLYLIKTDTLGNVTGIAESVSYSIPDKFWLAQNFPNPFNTCTNIEYTLSTDCEVKLEIYNAVGKKVATLVNQSQSAGHHRIQWQTRLTNGIYFLCIKAGEFSNVQKMVIMK